MRKSSSSSLHPVVPDSLPAIAAGQGITVAPAASCPGTRPFAHQEGTDELDPTQLSVDTRLHVRTLSGGMRGRHEAGLPLTRTGGSPGSVE